MSKYRILAVDDSDENLVLIRHFLSQNKSFEVIGFKHPQEALGAFKADPSFNLVLTDLYMPEMDGIEFMNKIRELGETKVVVVTGQDHLDWGDLGFDGYLLKPLDFKNIANQVLKLVEKQNDDYSSQLMFH